MSGSWHNVGYRYCVTVRQLHFAVCTYVSRVVNVWHVYFIPLFFGCWDRTCDDDCVRTWPLIPRSSARYWPLMSRPLTCLVSSVELGTESFWKRAWITSLPSNLRKIRLMPTTWKCRLLFHKYSMRLKYGSGSMNCVPLLYIF